MVDYLIGICLSNTVKTNRRRLLLSISLFVNLGFLGFFKYYNFFLQSFVDAFSFMGHTINPQGLNMILPVGISFYTFQTLSYSIDVYKRTAEPTKDIIAFFAFVSFFPQLVAGPIERAVNLLPQFQRQREFVYGRAVDGLRQILLGLFKKVVIADNCAHSVNLIFNNYLDHTGSTLLIGAVLFAFQIYGDFSGYSDIAIGTSRLFGFNIMKNFAFPYFSRDIAEFWRRWHISLSTWFRDYVYIPLGGSKKNKWVSVRNTFIIFLTSGFWHGANWTFVAWGFLHACFFLPLLILKRNRKNIDIVAKQRSLPNITELIQIGTTFLLIVLAWILFRAESLSQAFHIYNEIFSLSLFSWPQVLPKNMIFFIGILLSVEWFQRDKEHAFQIESYKIPIYFRWPEYYAVILILAYYSGSKQEFIYFQF
nr:MBOAT family O-acyltransferase [uncultured Desulfobacter sp.]